MICKHCNQDKYTFIVDKKNNICKCMLCNKEFKYIKKDTLIIAVDFDTVLSTYIRPFQYNKLGKPNKKVISVLKYFKEHGYEQHPIKIVIFTGRLKTQELYKWLDDNKVPYDGVNENLVVHRNCSRFKPYYDILIDDKAMNFHYRNNCSYNLENKIKKILKWSLEGKE